VAAAAARAERIDRIRALLEQGAPWAANDAFQAALADGPDDAELLYWGALASARSGASRQARVLLDRAQAMPGLSTALLHEVLCLGGRLWKDRALGVPATESPRPFLDRARDEYAKAYALGEDSYSGVNAATLSTLIGDRAASQTLARAVVAGLLAKSAPLDAWEHAALGEARLLLGDLAASRDHYGRACALSAGNAGNVATMRRQVRLLQQALPDAGQVLDVLPAATVLAFAGHMTDRPGQRGTRFPEALEPAVAAALRVALAALHLPVVYTSAACGADLLFIEAALDAGAEVNVVLPFNRDDFVLTSVSIGGARWLPRFDRALARVARVILATEESYLGDDVLFENALHLIEGLSVLRAAQLQTEPSLLCVLDFASAPVPGGTRATYDRWLRYRGTPDVIDLRALRRAAGIPDDDAAADGSDDRRPASPASELAARPQRTIKVLLFADIAGYGRVHDAFAPLFHSRFLRVVADELAACPEQPLEINTWGDALYVVFQAPAGGAEFALGLVRRIREVDWTAAGLAESSQIRVALHAGPVFCGFDPIIGRDNYFGSSVTRTARIEPVTPPGLIYASEAFVANLASRGHTRYAFEYVGNLELAKGYGESRLYRLERGTMVDSQEAEESSSAPRDAIRRASSPAVRTAE